MMKVAFNLVSRTLILILALSPYSVLNAQAHAGSILKPYHQLILTNCQNDEACLRQKMGLMALCSKENPVCEEKLLKKEEAISMKCNLESQCLSGENKNQLLCSEDQNCKKDLLFSKKTIKKEEQSLPSIYRYHGLINQNCLYDTSCIKGKVISLSRCIGVDCDVRTYDAEKEIKNECSKEVKNLQSCLQRNNEQMAVKLKSVVEKIASKPIEKTQVENVEIEQVAETKEKSASVKSTNNLKQEMPDELVKIKLHLEKMEIVDQVGVSEMQVVGGKKLQDIKKKYEKDISEISNAWK